MERVGAKALLGWPAGGGVGAVWALVAKSPSGGGIGMPLLVEEAPAAPAENPFENNPATSR